VAERYPLVDLLKAVAAQVIVLHHFAAYGPLSDLLHRMSPTVVRWLYDYGRMAVQVFLVTGGYLAARSLSGKSAPWRTPLTAIAKRFVRLTGPYVVALALAVIAAAIVRPVLHAPFVPAAPTWAQWFAHMALIQGLLHMDGLSAGVWYVAIDFQLYVTLILVFWVAQGKRSVQWLLALALTASSLLVFNRDPLWDNTALYFWGAYGLGAWAWWGSFEPVPWQAKAALCVTLVVSLVALHVDFRIRVGLALATGSALWLWGQSSRWLPEPMARLASYLSQRSYALFLVHFPVLMLVNALFSKLTAPQTMMGVASVIVGWGLSLACAEWLYRGIEVRINTLR
jgi:peptidoglycan/LPS O-acetylase OafA/YrhL